MPQKSKIFYELRLKPNRINSALILAEENNKDADIAIGKLLSFQEKLISENSNLKKEIEKLKFTILQNEINHGNK